MIDVLFCLIESSTVYSTGRPRQCISRGVAGGGKKPSGAVVEVFL